jgi:type III secretory pathway component EscS
MRNLAGVVKIVNIMILLLLLVIGLVIWSVRLLQGAYRLQDASLAIASALVAVSAGGVVIVYGLMDGCLGQFSQMGVSQANADLDLIMPGEMDLASSIVVTPPNTYPHL